MLILLIALLLLWLVTQQIPLAMKPKMAFNLVYSIIVLLVVLVVMYGFISGIATHGLEILR